MKTRPLSTEYAPYYEKYIGLVPDGDIFAMLRAQALELERGFGQIGAQHETFAYAPGKWTFRQVLGHLIDGERIFGLRAYCFSRGEKAPLPSFDENTYVDAGRYEGVPLSDLIAEFTVVRAANLAFLARLDDAQWVMQGTASGKTISVRALVWIMAGHVAHHLAIHTERYLPGVRS
jgi:hypothetical protein